jgi:hypothetical protein
MSGASLSKSLTEEIITLDVAPPWEQIILAFKIRRKRLYFVYR